VLLVLALFLVIPFTVSAKENVNGKNKESLSEVEMIWAPAPTEESNSNGDVT
jgi:hypothetical protein